MRNISNTPRPNWLSAMRNALAVVAMIGFGTGAALAAPLAGTTIGNQAAATYTDASAITRTATSNTVVTTVQQVAALTLVTPQTVVGAPGQPISLPHTLTNTGNGNDTYALGLQGAITPGDPALASVTFFPDTNCDGVADSGAPAITSVGPVAPGASACFIAQTAVSPTAVSSAPAVSGSFTILATSGFTPATTATNLDQVTVSTNAVIGVTKSMTVAAGAGGSVDITYILSYTNTGNATATDVVLADVVPASTNYVANSGKWNNAAVPDGGAAAGVPAPGTVTYDYNFSAVGTVTARIGSVPANNSGTLSFVVNVPAGTLPGTINNTGHFCYNNSAAVVPAGQTSSTCSTGGTPTNTVPYVVGPSYAAIATDYFQAPNLQAASAVTPTDSTTTDNAVKDDIVTVASATQGASVSFDNVIANAGNSSDSFNISTSASSFPAGTTFLYFKAGGLTPLTDTNGDGIVDTGPIAPGASYHVVIQAILPTTASSAVASNVTVTATSVGDVTKFDTVTDRLSAITANSVDLTNNGPLPAGAGNGVVATAVAANGGAIVTTNAVNPGATTTFTLVVNNTSAAADTYGLTVDPVAPLPTGWAVNFYSAGTPGSCATLGASLSNTGAILGGGNLTVCAVVSVPATQVAIPAPGQHIVFKVSSPSSGAKDFKLDAVTVNTVRSISLSPNNAAQIYPGGAVVYKHTLINTGNVTETALSLAPVTSGATANWATVLYADTNTNGVLDAADLPLGAVTLTAGQSITVFNKVLAPGAAAAGDVNTVTIAASQPNAALVNGVGAPANSTAQDVTTVIAGQVSLAKRHQVDAACSGTAVPASWTDVPLTAKPGECVLYQITGTNVGAAAVTSLVISDATPASTRYSCSGAGAGVAGVGSSIVGLTGGGAAVPTAPAQCAAGNVSSGTIATLAPGASVVFTFGVQINP